MVSYGNIFNVVKQGNVGEQPDATTAYMLNRQANVCRFFVVAVSQKRVNSGGWGAEPPLFKLRNAPRKISLFDCRPYPNPLQASSISWLFPALKSIQPYGLHRRLEVLPLSL